MMLGWLLSTCHTHSSRTTTTIASLQVRALAARLLADSISAFFNIIPAERKAELQTVQPTSLPLRVFLRETSADFELLMCRLTHR